MRTLELGRRFDVVIAWDSFFHLPPADQRAMFAVFAKHVTGCGVLLFTSGPEEGTRIGNLHGHELYHASLSPAEYRSLLNQHRFDVRLYRPEDPQCGLHTVWVAQFTA